MRLNRRLLMVLLAVLMLLPLSARSTFAQSKVTVTYWDIFTTPQASVDYINKVAADGI